MEIIKYWALYFSVSGLVCFLRAFYKMEVKKEDTEELQELNRWVTNNQIYLLTLLFGWMMLPSVILIKVYKSITKKDLF